VPKNQPFCPSDGSLEPIFPTPNSNRYSDEICGLKEFLCSSRLIAAITERTAQIIAKLDALLPAFLDKAFIRLHRISARQEGKL
jgi:hypothetical protein